MTKILYVCRLFSGLEESIDKKHWDPTGVPTIYKVINKLKHNNKKFKLILTVKDSYSKLQENKTKNIDIPGFLLPVTILKGTKHNSNFRLVKNIYREFTQFLNIIRIYLAFNPQLIYIDNSNIWSAGLISRITKTPVVFRVMGVYEYMHTLINKKSPTILERFLIWLYKSPFKLVVCTQDGSGVENWLKKAIRPNVKTEVLLNGITDNNNNKSVIPFNDKNTYITFLGKLEFAKGAEQFVRAMISVLEKSKDSNIIINIIGFGSLRDKLVSLTKNKNFYKHFRFVERLPNKHVLPILKKTDIYVSLNRAGNISNANLEAISASCCMIIPKSQKKNGIDLYTDKILSEDTVFRINSSDDINGLIHLTLDLISNKDKIKMKRNSIKKLKKSFKNWSQRVELEVNILSTLIQKNY